MLKSFNLFISIKEKKLHICKRIHVYGIRITPDLRLSTKVIAQRLDLSFSVSF